MSSSKGNKGIGHSGPRVVVGGGVPNNAPNTTTRNLGVPSLPGGLGTPPLVKSKLVVLPPGSSSNRSGQSQVANLPYTTQQQQAPPMRSSTQQQNRPPTISSQQSTDASFQLATALAPSSKPVYAQNQPPPPASNQTPVTPGGNTNISNNNNINTNNNNVTPGVATPNEVAMSSPMTPSMARSIDNSDNMRHQPHIVNMPPPPPPVASTNQSSNTTFAHPLENTGQQQQQVYQPYSQQQPIASSTASSTSVAHPLHTTNQQQPQVAVATSKAKAQLDPPTQQQQKKKVSPTKKTSLTKQQQKNKPTPEDEVDAFLSGPMTNLQGNIKLHPTPLPTSLTSMQKVNELVKRRSYGDIIRVTNDLLLGTSGSNSSGYSMIYNELVHAKSSSASSSNSSNVSGDIEKVRQETCELIAIRLIAQLKLRRYVDLGKEVDALGLMPYLPDHKKEGETSEQHTRAISGIPNIEKNLIPATPGTPGTLATETEISVVHEQQSSSTATQKATDDKPPLAWREGSLHSSSSTDTLPSWVPFGLRIIAAMQLQYNDGSSKAIDVLYDLRDRCVRVEYWNTTGMEIWLGVIDNALVNSFVRKREWRLALKSLDDLIANLDVGVDREVDWWCNDVKGGAVSDEERQQMKDVITAAAHVELQSRQLLILLQSGALSAGEMIQNDVRLQATKVQSQLSEISSSNMTTLSRVTKDMALVRQVPIRHKLNEGLLQFARSKYTEAATYFREALQQQRQLDLVNASSLHGTGCPTYKDLSTPTLGFDATPSLTVECLNNLSLCLLYSGDMRSAVQELEGLIREDPCVYLTEGMAFNLCTLYELGFDGEECSRKKKLLQRVAKRFSLHDISVESFRLG